MDTSSITLTVFFENPFWVGIFEHVSNGSLSVVRIFFGAMPKENEIYEFIQKKFAKLNFNFKTDFATKKSPKKLKKLAQKQMKKVGVGTKSQIALKMQLEANKIVRKKISKEEKEIRRQYKFDLRQRKRKEKHRGK